MLTIPAHEAGFVRVFAIDALDPALATILPPHLLDAGHLARLLGVESLREGDVERVAIRDLGDYTLSEFLRIGHDTRSSDLAPHAADLDALQGHVVLIHSTAFAGKPATLSPAPGLRLVATLRRNEAPPPPLSLPEAERPEILVPQGKAESSRRRRPWAAILLTILLLIILFERLMS